jgi:hypothetical protein
MEALKGTDKDPNSLLPPATVEKYEVVDWQFGPLIHLPAMAHLGKPNGRICLTDLDPVYAEKLVLAGCQYIKRKEVPQAKAKAAQPVEEAKAGK